MRFFIAAIILVTNLLLSGKSLSIVNDITNLHYLLIDFLPTTYDFISLNIMTFYLRVAFWRRGQCWVGS